MKKYFLIAGSMLIAACIPTDVKSKEFFSQIQSRFESGATEVQVKNIVEGDWDEVCLVTGDDTEPHAAQILARYLTEAGFNGAQYGDAPYYIFFSNKTNHSIDIFSAKNPLVIKGERYHFEVDGDKYIKCSKYINAKIYANDASVKTINLK